MKKFELNGEHCVNIGDRFFDHGLSDTDSPMSIKLSAITAIELTREYDLYDRDHKEVKQAWLYIFHSGHFYKIHGSNDELTAIYNYLKSVL